MSRAKPRRDGVLAIAIGIGLVAAIAFFLGTAFDDQSQPVVATAPVPTVLAPQEASALAEFRACEPLEVERYKILEEMKANFVEHAKAHHDMIKGTISKEKRNEIWKKTLGRLHELEPPLAQLDAIWNKECGK